MKALPDTESSNTCLYGYQLKHAEGGGEARPCEVDLVESIPYLLGMDINRMYRKSQGVVILGRNRRGQSVAVFFRDCTAKDSAQWVQAKLAQRPADRVYTNDPAGLSFEGCDSLEAIESVFAARFGRPSWQWQSDLAMPGCLPIEGC